MISDTTGTTSGGAKPWATPEDKKQTIIALYQQYLGRDPDETGLSGYLTAANPTYVEQALKNSKEYQARQAGGAPTAANPFIPKPTLASVGALQPARGMGWGGGAVTTGFDYQDAGQRGGTYADLLRGFNTSEKVWNPDHQDYHAIKNIAARVFAQIDPHSANAAQQAVDAFRQYGIDASVENPDGAADRIRFSATGESVDVLQNRYGAGAYEGDTGWQWIDSNYETPATQGEQNLAALASPVAPPSQSASIPLANPGDSTPTTTGPAAGNEPAGSTGTMATGEQERFLEQYVRPFFESRGMKVLEIVGGKMHVLSPEDQAQGRSEGTWVSIGFDPLSGMAGAGA